MTPDCFTASLEPGTNVGRENLPSAGDPWVSRCCPKRLRSCLKVDLQTTD